MEQLVNESLKFIAKAGGATIIMQLIDTISEHGNVKTWSEEEADKATDYLRTLNEYFSRTDAVEIVENLVEKYRLKPEDITAFNSQHVKLGVGELD